jgi:hypothetical protein
VVTPQVQKSSARLKLFAPAVACSLPLHPKSRHLDRIVSSAVEIPPHFVFVLALAVVRSAPKKLVIPPVSE